MTPPAANAPTVVAPPTVNTYGPLSDAFDGVPDCRNASPSSTSPELTAIIWKWLASMTYNAKFVLPAGPRRVAVPRPPAIE